MKSFEGGPNSGALGTRIGDLQKFFEGFSKIFENFSKNFEGRLQKIFEGGEPLRARRTGF